jgi:hypothetical protein
VPCRGKCQLRHHYRPGKVYRLVGNGDSASGSTSKVVDVFDTIADVGPILPHPIESEIPDGTGLGLETLGIRRNLYFDDRSFVDGHVFEGLEDAVFVSCCDGQVLPFAELVLP